MKKGERPLPLFFFQDPFTETTKSQELFEIPGLRLPDNLKRLDSDIIIYEFGEVVNPFF